MTKEIVSCKLTPAERETIINIFKDENGVDIIEAETSRPKDYHKMLRANWTLTKLQEHRDGSFVAAQFTAPANMLTFRTFKQG